MNELNSGWIFLFVFGGIAIIFSLAWLICQIIETYFSDAFLCHGSTYYKRCDSRQKRIENIKTSLLSLLFVATTSLVLSFGITGTLNDYNREYNNKVYDIVSLERDKDIKGAFCLGTGYIESTPVYYAYTVTDYGYKLAHFETSYTYLIETDVVSPCVYKQKESGNFNSHYTIYCPVGTIVKIYTV